MDFFKLDASKEKNNGFYSSILTPYRFYIENKLWTRNFSQVVTVQSLMLNATFPNCTRRIGIFIFTFFFNVILVWPSQSPRVRMTCYIISSSFLRVASEFY